MDAEHRLHEIAAELSKTRNVAPGKWFGKTCLKVDGKVFAALWQGDLAFKLVGEAHAEALQVQGARPFDPRGKGYPMKEWVQITARHSETWSRFAELACDYVAGAAQAKKDEVIGGLVGARTKILHAVRLLSQTQQDEAFLDEWSVKDLLAHLVGWDHTNREAVGQILAGTKPSFWAHYDRDWQSYNARLVAEHRREDFAEMIAMVEQSHRELIDYLQAIPADEYVKRKPIGTLLRAEASDEEEHYRQIEAFRAGRER